MPALHLIAILLLAVSSNLDNVGVGVSYGIRKINIPITSNLLIAVVTSTGTFLSILLGVAIYHFLSEEMAGLLGGAIIILAGIWVIFQEKVMHWGSEPRKEEQLIANAGLHRFGFRQIVLILNHPILADWDFSGHIDLREATALAFGLTLNNIPNGVGAGMLGFSLSITTSAVFLFSIMTIWIGTYIGHLGIRWVGKSAGLISGLILILLGVSEIFF
jgi:putative sporulation protein YtaF